MYTVERNEIINTIKDMFIDSAYNLNNKLVNKFERAEKLETNKLGKSILRKIIENQVIAKTENIPLCQDTGVAVIFLEIGRQLIFSYDLEKAINTGVRKAYMDGYLRKSIVQHPLNRINTLDNTPAIIHYNYIPGKNLNIHIAPKGGGSENMSRLKMLSPSEGEEGIINFVLETIKLAGGKACPPLIVGVGIGGNFEKVALLAKQAIFRKINDSSKSLIDRNLEEKLLKKINQLDIGPMGLGGLTTALAVKVNSYPCHIASLPVAVNLQCHSARKKEVTLVGKKINNSN
ncbi:MAG: fumarate hydratase [Candidatus Izimaplasma sp.]|nr:fumarate hydratase [Candidatus Izimaplasma bacterium]